MESWLTESHRGSPSVSQSRKDAVSNGAGEGHMSTSFATATRLRRGSRSFNRREFNAALFGNLTTMASTISGEVADTQSRAPLVRLWSTRSKLPVG